MNQTEIKKICPSCQKEFIAKGSNRFRQNYCSEKCRKKDDHKRKYIPITHIIICKKCKKEVKTNSSTMKFCSVKCRNRYWYEKTGQVIKYINCLQCGEPFETTTCKKYCSDDCRLISHYERHRAYYGRKARERGRKRKLQVFQYYSKSLKPYCEICKIDDIDVLTLDHINNNGNIHRKTMKSHNLYYELIKTNFPNGYQILCRNCNYKKFIEYKKEERRKIIEKYYAKN